MDYPELKEIERRPFKHWSVDGVALLVVGVQLTLWGVLFLVVRGLPEGRLRTVYWMVLMALVSCSGVGAAWAKKRLKERITIPRAGYARPRRPRWLLVAGALLGTLVVVGLFTLILTAKAHGLQRFLAPAGAATIALGFGVGAVVSRGLDFLLVSGAALVVALWLYRARGGLTELLWMYVVLGLLCMAVGGFRLRRFLRANPKPVE